MSRVSLAVVLHVGSAAWLTAALLVNGSATVNAQGGSPSLDALSERVKKLEARVAEDEQQAGGGSGKNAPTRMRTPFSIVDSKGREVLAVEEVGDGHVLRMGKLGSGTAIQFERTNDRALFITQMGGGGAETRLGVGETTGPRLVVYEAQHSTLVGAGPDNKHGVFVRGGETRGGASPKLLGEMAVTYGETGGILRLYDKEGQTPVITAGSNVKEAGRGQIGIGAAGSKSIGVLLFTAADGHGEMGVYGDGNGKAIVEVSGSKRQITVSNRSGNPAAVMRLGQGGTGSGGNITLVDGAGNNVVSAGARSDGGGTLCALHNKRGNQCFP